MEMETTEYAPEEPVIKPVTAAELAVMEGLIARLDVNQLKAVNTIVVARINGIEAPTRSSRHWRVGDLVEFTHQSTVHRARIKSVNLRTASCLPADGPGRGWRVPFGMLRLVGADKSVEVSIPLAAPVVPAAPAVPDAVMAVAGGNPGDEPVSPMMGSW